MINSAIKGRKRRFELSQSYQTTLALRGREIGTDVGGDGQRELDGPV